MITFRVFVPFALGYFLSYLYRAVNAVIAPDLIRDLGLDAADLGLLTSTYFLTFAAFQLPLGLLLDRFGPRRTEAALLLFAAAGAGTFAAAPSTEMLIVGRALIGFGVSACLMAAFKAFVIWFPRERLPLVYGIQMAAGGLGALTATVPVEAALHITDWRGVFWILGGLTIVASGVLFFAVPEKQTGQPQTTFGEQLRGVARIFSSPVFWRVAPVTVAAQAAFLSIQSLWTGPWLRDVGGLDRGAVADSLLMIAAAMIAGFISIAVLTDRLARWGVKPMSVAVPAMGLFMVLQAAIIIQPAGQMADPMAGAGLSLWMLFGFFGTTGILPYAVMSQSFPPHLAGRVNTGLNVLVFTSAFCAQWGMGAIINLWPVSPSGGYDPAGYQAAFTVMLALQGAAMTWYLLFRRSL